MNDANQAADLEELAEQLMGASTGRLDVRVKVRGDEPKPLGDPANDSLGNLRGLVLDVRGGSEPLLRRGHRAQEGASAFGESVSEAAGYVGAALGAMQDLLASVRDSQSTMERCRDVAARSLEMARYAGHDAKQAGQGLDDMRASMQETGKRIKRLGERSQEIGEVVRLIDDVADQSNVLAVNAAIQSSLGGEAGEGFAILVEEIGRLSERARAATGEIETLVRAIQSDCGEAIKAVERVASGVVSTSDASARSATAMAKVEKAAERLGSAIGGVAHSIEKQGPRTQAVVGDLSAAERSLGSLRGDCLSLSGSLEEVMEMADVVSKIGAIVLEPGQKKHPGARGAS